MICTGAVACKFCETCAACGCKLSSLMDAKLLNVVFTTAVDRLPPGGITLIGCGSLNTAWLAAPAEDGYD